VAELRNSREHGDSVALAPDFLGQDTDEVRD